MIQVQEYMEWIFMLFYRDLGNVLINGNDVREKWGNYKKLIKRMR